MPLMPLELASFNYIHTSAITEQDGTCRGLRSSFLDSKPSRVSASLGKRMAPQGVAFDWSAIRQFGRVGHVPSPPASKADTVQAVAGWTPVSSSMLESWASALCQQS